MLIFVSCLYLIIFDFNAKLAIFRLGPPAEKMLVVTSVGATVGVLVGASVGYWQTQVLAAEHCSIVVDAELKNTLAGWLE